jgi:glycosyltransferase involved in cell wall biosynthesis
VNEFRLAPTGAGDTLAAPMPDPARELLVVIPVYNEQASIRKVVMEWFQEIENWTENFVFLVINDGSTDSTSKLLHRLQTQLGRRLEIIERENRGHGQTCLEGYREAVARSFRHVFQIDSDGQCDPQYFFRFWRERENYDVIYGQRTRRDDGWRRVFASLILRVALFVWCRVNCVDANVPYRLMNTSILGDVLPRIPSDFFLANVAMAVLLKRNPSVRHGCVPIRFRERYGGEPTVRLNQFGARAGELFGQLKAL